MPHKDTETRATLEKIIWRHYSPGSALDVEEVLDEMMPVVEEVRTQTLGEVKAILVDEINLAHTTTAGKTSRLTSAYNRVAALSAIEGLKK